MEKYFDINDNILIKYTGADREIILPEGIEEIAPQAFQGSLITTITLPSTLKKIGHHAFSNCKFLENISIPEGVEIITAGAFSACASLKNAVLPTSLKILEDFSFENCLALEEILLPDGLVSIGHNCFQDCRSLKEIILPASVSSIGVNVFSNCTSLEEIKCDPELRVGIANNIFRNCDKLIDEKGMLIAANVLWRYTGTEEDVVIPEGVKGIANGVFQELGSNKRRIFWDYANRPEGSLKSVTFPSTLEMIGDSCFYGCVALTEINLPENVKIIGAGAFSACRNLKQISLPQGLITISANAFNTCESLTVVHLPDSLTELSTNAFVACKNLTEIRIPEGIKKLSNWVFSECSSLKKISLPSTIEIIDVSIFKNCTSLETIELEENEFYTCENSVLFSKDKSTLIYYPGGKGITEYTIPECITTIGTNAFRECRSLEKLMIPANVTTLEDRAFCILGSSLKEIIADPKSCKASVGSFVFNIDEMGGPTHMFYPCLPPHVFKGDKIAQNYLAFAYIDNPDAYSGEYAKLYQKYVKSNRKSMIKLVQSLYSSQIDESWKKKMLSCLEALDPDKKVEKKETGYKPDLKVKKPSELKKVSILEEAVLKGTLEDVKAVLETYKTFELTSRALGLAGRYRGLDFVKVLYEHGASFMYTYTPELQRKYSMAYKREWNQFETLYYLMLLPEKIDFEDKNMYYTYSETPLCGLYCMSELAGPYEEKVIPLSERMEIAKYVRDNHKEDISYSQMLFYALIHGEIDAADALIAMGADFSDRGHRYYGPNYPLYLDIISGKLNDPNNMYIDGYKRGLAQISRAQTEKLLPVLERYDRFVKEKNMKLAFTQKMFKDITWEENSLLWFIDHADYSEHGKVTQKSIMEYAASHSCVSVLTRVAELGWLKTKSKREGLLAYAKEENNTEIVAWLMDFTNKTVDLKKEAQKEEAKLMRELTENPNSVSAMKKIWSYKKLEDGTLIITSYKGQDTDIEIPAMIGKAAVSVIGSGAFDPFQARVKNEEARKHITRITVPEGVTLIEKGAFSSCRNLTSVTLPSTLECIEDKAFYHCNQLKEIIFPENVRSIGTDIFSECSSLRDEDGFIILGGILFDYEGNQTVLTIPDTVKRLAPYALGYSFGYRKSSIKDQITEITLPEGITVIPEGAFRKLLALKQVHLPSTLKRIESYAFSDTQLEEIILPEELEFIGYWAFYSTKIQQVRIPESVQKIEKWAFHNFELYEIFIPNGDTLLDEEIIYSGQYKKNQIYIHTPAGSNVARLFGGQENVHIVE